MEEVQVKDEAQKTEWRQGSTKSKLIKAKTLDEIESSPTYRITSPDEELNRVLGGGIVPGSLILIGGEPGIGKSTLMLQAGLMMKDLKILYVSGEESEQQIKMRAQRIGYSSDRFYMLTETQTRNIFISVESIEPDIVIIDSIQTLFSNALDSSAGSIGQVRQCAGEFMKFAKETETPVFLIGHITKDGMLAGPKVL